MLCNFPVFLRHDAILLRSLAGLRNRHPQDGSDRRDGGPVLHHRHPSGLRRAGTRILGHSGNVLQLFCTAYHRRAMQNDFQNTDVKPNCSIEAPCSSKSRCVCKLRLYFSINEPSKNRVQVILYAS